MRYSIETRQAAGDTHLASLLQYFSISNTRLEQAQSYVLQIVGFGVAILGGVTTYLAKQDQTVVPSGVAWLAPFLWIVFCSLLVWSLNNYIHLVWVCRLVAMRINSLLPEVVISEWLPKSPAMDFFSPQRGNLKMRLLYLLLFMAFVVLFFAITGVCFQVIYAVNHLFATLFSLLYAFLALIVVYCVSAMIIDLPASYVKFGNKYALEKGIPMQFPLISEDSAGNQRLLAWVLPRRKDIAVKAHNWWIGFTVALVTVGLVPRQVQILNALFRGKCDWATVAMVSGISVFCLALLYCSVEELLLQQAKLLWDDVRDMSSGRDNVMTQSYRRAVAVGLLTRNQAILNASVRGIFALILGYWLGGLTLFYLFLIILLHQAIYIMWAKPRAELHPVTLLFVLSLNLPLRVLAGAMAVVRSQWAYSTVILTFAMIYFCSLGTMASQWRIEGDERRSKNRKSSIRLQTKFYLQNGVYWQYVGFISAMLIGAFTILLQIFASSPNISLPFLSMWFGRWSPSDQTVIYSALGSGGGILTIAALIGTFTFVTRVILFLTQGIHSIVRDRIRALRPIANVLLIASFLLLIAALRGIIHDSSILLFLSLFLLDVGCLLLFEGITYREYTLENVKTIINFIIKTWYAFLFMPEKGISGRLAIGVTGSPKRCPA